MSRELTPQETAERSLIKTYRKSIWNPFIAAVKRYELIEPGDRIAVCISGGKDSVILAKLMQELQRHTSQPFELVFMVMDPGYKPENRKLIEDNAALLGIPITIFDSDIFDVTQLESGQMRLSPENFDVEQLFRGAIEPFREDAERKRQTFVPVCREISFPTLYGDPTRLQQICVNLLSNAIRYTPEGKHIEISAARTGNSVRLSVFNEGEGLPEEELPKIWEKFYRTDRARTREAGGTGIGLSLVRAIADTLHGACGAENVEGGICFWFELPDLLPAEDSEIKD